MSFENEHSAGAVVYMWKGGRPLYLFLKRKEGWLDVPKGHMEIGEGPRDTALRETKEESGLDIRLDRYFRHDLEYMVAKNGMQIKKRVTLFLAEVPPSAKVKISNEHADYEWLDFEAALERSAFKDQAAATKTAHDYVLRLRKMKELNSAYGRLPSIHKKIWDLSKRLVPGEGPLNAKVMFVGQAPGAYEDEQLRPFVGISGRLLDGLIERAGLKRDEVYITSLVQFFPPENRVPTNREAMMCMPFFDGQVDIIGPRLMVLLGNFASMGVAGVGEVGTRHGTLIRNREHACDMFITYHPAAAVRIKKLVPVIQKDFEGLKRIVAGIES